MSRLDLKRGLCVRVTPSSLSANDLKSMLPQSRMDQEKDVVTLGPKKDSVFAFNVFFVP